MPLRTIKHILIVVKTLTFTHITWNENNKVLTPVHTKHDNYKVNDKDIVLKIVLNIKE